MTSNDLRIDSRILRDMNDGAFVLDTTGTVLYINNRGLELLGINRDFTGEKYAAVFLGSEAQNDEFHQLVVDAIYHKDKSQTRIVPWLGGRVQRKCSN